MEGGGQKGTLEYQGGGVHMQREKRGWEWYYPRGGGGGGELRGGTITARP